MISPRFQPVIILIICFSLSALQGCKSLKNKPSEQPVLAMEFPEIEISATPPGYKGSETIIFRLLHTKLQLWPNFPMRQLRGLAVLTLTPHAYPQDTVVLDARNFQLNSVFNAVDRLKAELPYRYDNQKLYIFLQKTALPGKDTIQIGIDYIVMPELQYPEKVVSKKDQRGLYFINPEGKDSLVPVQLWTQGETHHNSAWMPTIEAPNQKLTHEIALTVDTAFVTLSNGALTTSTPNGDGTRTDVWKQSKPHAPYLAMIAVGKWHITRDKWRDSIPVNYYMEPAYAPYAGTIFGNTPEMMTFFSEILGYDFPWAKYSQVVVRDFVSGAMENTSAVVHFELLQHDARAHLDETYEDVVAHELFHHWFGDLVTCESWAQLSMNEGFATMGEYLWRGYKYGRQEEALKRKEDLEAYLREAAYNKDAIINHFYRDPEALFDRHRYEKGGLVLHMLRRYLGDDVFFKALSRYLNDRAFKTTEMHRLRMAFEDAGGEDLNWFFDQWFQRPGHPELVIRQAYNEQKKKLLLIVEQKQEGENVPVFRLPVELEIIVSKNNKVQKRIWLQNKLDTFTFDAADKPLLVNFDVGKDLLCQKREYKPRNQWMYQFQRSPYFLDKMEAMEAIAAAAGNMQKDSLNIIISAALTDSFWSIRKIALERFFLTRQFYEQGQFRQLVREMALRDKKASVRKAAILVVQRLEGGEGMDIFKAAMNDSSYQVTAAAIESYFKNTPPADTAEIIKTVSAFENYTNPDVLFVVAGIYAKYGKKDKLPFFHRLAYILSTQHSSSILGMYKDFLARTDAATVQEELPFIYKLESRMQSTWGRFAYKIFLNDLRHELRKGKLSKSKILSQEKIEKLVAELGKRAGAIEVGSD